MIAAGGRAKAVPLSNVASIIGSRLFSDGATREVYRGDLGQFILEAPAAVLLHPCAIPIPYSSRLALTSRQPTKPAARVVSALTPVFDAAS